MLAAAGFTVRDRLIINVDIKSSSSDAVGRYALATLQRIRATAADALAADDLAALDRLLDTTSPDSILCRNDLAVQTTRTVWAARRTSEGTTVAVTALRQAPAADGQSD